MLEEAGLDLFGRCHIMNKVLIGLWGISVMRRVLAIVCVSLGALFGCVDGGNAAPPDIGSAALAKNDVSRELSGANGPVATGDPVFTDEIVRTGVDSATKLVFRDSTNLALGPKSRVMLDRFIFDPSQPSQAVGVTLAKGLFRLTTGNLQKSAYSVSTPTAVIGVRGTVLDIDVLSNRTRVTLVEGGALVCPRKKGISFAQQARNCERGPSHCDCADLTITGQTAQVSNSQASLISTPVQFANLCSGGGALCSGENYASLPNHTFAESGAPPPGGAPVPPPVFAVVAPFAGLAGILVTGGVLTHNPVSP